ncbi:hypothetical protein [Bradyrhizobium genosp. P]|uniref:hypothetical protein n=1 Tax=Bradyrhizobium genosp. P TaxID=83641 RepID=UPI003CEA80E1
MDVEAIGRPEQLANLRSGQCFFFDSGYGPRLGMLSQDESNNGFLVFGKPDEDDRGPWVITGGLPQTLLVVDDIRIRTDWTSLESGAAVDLGSITSAAGSFYMRAALRGIETATINLVSGLLEQIPSSGAVFHYTRWGAGIIRDNKWLSLVEFPFKNPPSSD